MPTLPVIQPSAMTLMIKPVGALCNLDCHYCYYLPTLDLYEQRERRMSLEVLESIFAGFLPEAADQVTICWQGGEPTLAGLDFFKQAIAYQHRYARRGQTVTNALQTNGTCLTDDWCIFFKAHEFLIGISLDGPAHLHDPYRTTKSGRGSYPDVQRGLRLLQSHRVEYNVLCVLNQRNVKHPDEVLHHLLNTGSRWIQFIPAMEWQCQSASPSASPSARPALADFSPSAEDYGRFMSRVFDLWFDRYRQRLSVRLFDALLNKLVLNQMPYCMFDQSCHGQVTIEHNGDVYGCDHFVERRWQLGRIGEPTWENQLDFAGDAQVGLQIGGTNEQTNATTTTCEIVTFDPDWFHRLDSERLRHFASRKSDLPDSCTECEYLSFCYGGCPKHRPDRGDTVAPTTLCAGYQMLFEHALPRLAWLAGYLRRGQQPPAPQLIEQCRNQPVSRPSRNQPCPCGSGLKYKNCCGKRS